MSIPWDNLNDQALAQLMEAYLLGILTDEQIDRFETSLLHNPQAADLCAQAIETVAMTREVFRDYQEQRAVLGRDETLQGFHELLAELGEAEDRAEAQLVHLVGHVKTRQPLWQQWQFVIPSAIAALLAIAVILIVMVPTGTSPTRSPGLAQTPDPSNTPALLPAQPVATLTAQHNATWAEGAFAPGSPLHSGTRLTLTAGFAEITTNRGAIAILEAPATVELLDNNNALRLHGGKLVGICETDASKGFLVRTPHMDITDLGTEFGVEVDRFGTAAAEVFTGRVVVAPHTAAGPSTKHDLMAGQAMRVNAQSQRPEVSDADSTRFSRDILAVAVTPKVSGQGRYLQSRPDRVTFHAFESTDHISVFLERQGVPWQHDWPVVVKSGSVQGQAVDSYLVHYDPVGNPSLNAGPNVSDPAREVVLRFDRPILGVITKADGLVATDAALGHPKTVYPQASETNKFIDQRGMDGQGDRYQISDDGYAITVRMVAAGHSDQMRVLVKATE